ncbi:hypothetical protein SpCBS45565_g04414 [Spizellomyces sp. 'palustris']|nr:hypothetical protein SpCBS45565_g04414 [Spizellomyces sp. 'palustris']
MRVKSASLVLSALLASGSALPQGIRPPPSTEFATTAEWLKDVDRRLTAESTLSSEAQWSFDTNLTDANEAIANAASLRFNQLMTTILAESTQYQGTSEDEKRQLNLIKLNGGIPKDVAVQKELTEALSKMSSIYSTSKANGKPLDPDLTEILATSRDYNTLLEAYISWRNATGPLIKPIYTRFVELSNKGAVDGGFKDTSVLWRAGYDMEQDEFTAMMEKALQQVTPLYEQLHCYARSKLSEIYGKDKVELDGGYMPAHILGNMWSQEWGGIYDLLIPYPAVQPIDTTAELKKQGYDAVKMHELSESFYTSLGMDELPESFWTKSMLTKPTDREAVCHASAWDFNNDDLRIKMCTVVSHNDLMTVHHEQGHLYYDHYYRNQPYLFRSGAADFFHEAIGDTMQLSVVTASHLQKVGLITGNVTTSPEQVINAQMAVALDKIVSLPWTYLVDQWRWRVFAGEIQPDKYQQEWETLIEKYQGVKRPVPSGANDFDPGAKYHIPANTPYIRYFGANVIQFSFHKALCKTAGYTGPLHECDIFGSKEAGEQFKRMLSLGQSKAWQEAMKIGTNGMFDTVDGSAIIEYFAPLLEWLREQNAGKQCGWGASRQPGGSKPGNGDKPGNGGKPDNGGKPGNPGSPDSGKPGYGKCPSKKY